MQTLIDKGYETQEDFLLDPALRLYLPLYMLDGSSFMSRDGYGHLCTVTGALWRPNGHYFDATDDIISCGSGSSLDDIFDNGGTVEAWINPASRGEANNGFIVSKCDDAIPTTGWDLQCRILSGSTIGLRFPHTFTATDGFWDVTAANAGIVLDTWTHVVVTYTATAGTAPIIYVNASSKTVTTTQDSVGTRDSDAALNVSIGNEPGTTRTFDNLIGEVRLYNRALSVTEIQRHHELTKWRYR